jgi:hypothetical protein
MLNCLVVKKPKQALTANNERNQLLWIMNDGKRICLLVSAFHFSLLQFWSCFTFNSVFSFLALRFLLYILLVNQSHVDEYVFIFNFSL